MDVQLQYSYLLVVQSPDLFLAKTATDIWLFRKGQNVQRIGLLGWGGGVHIYFQQKRIIEGRGTERIFVCQPVVLGKGSKRELSYKNKDAEAFGAKIFYCLAQQVTKEQQKKKVAPRFFSFLFK